MQEFLQILHEQYRTEYYGPWHTRECYPWEYDVKAQECIQRGNKPSYFVTEEDCKFYQQQAKILQDRAAYIRHEWARQEAALQAKQTVIQLATQSDILQEEEQCSTERIAETVSSSSDTTGLLSTVSHQSTQSSTQSATQPEHSVEQEEEPLLQANVEKTAENTAEKSSGSKAFSTKNTGLLSKIPRHMLSTIPRQIFTQQAENDTTTWPVIPTALIGYITAMTSQEEDLLRRSQPIGPLQARVTYRTMHIWTN